MEVQVVMIFFFFAGKKKWVEESNLLIKYSYS